ncbi:MAG TPA: hypothetical protein PK956_03230 [Burkholderiaceae bacterium]|jgi:hypothetical protein|nr:hypothetical protein [Burkholderiaceae bacterium]HRA77797.1 hypothetical protein [Burkholderiaceae bacterium]
MAGKLLRYGGQGILYLLFAAFIGYFSTAPAYQHLAPNEGLLRLSFRHPGEFATDCRQRTAEELAKLPPQLRAQMDCPRERSPVHVRVELDGQVLYDERFQPAGLRRDGAASGYHRLPIPAGEHRLRVQVNDNARVKGFTHEGERQLTIAPGQVVLIDFIADMGGVVIR